MIKLNTMSFGLLALAAYGAVRGIGALLPGESSLEGTYVAPAAPVQPLIRAENAQALMGFEPR